MNFQPTLTDTLPMLQTRWAGGDVPRQRPQARAAGPSTVVHSTKQAPDPDEPDDLGYRLSGLAVRFDEPVCVAPGGPKYILLSGCFAQPLYMQRKRPIPLVWRHHDRQIIADPGNVHLCERKDGLHIECWPDDSPVGQLVVSKLKAGEHLGFSVSWWPVASKTVGGVVVVAAAGLNHVAITPFPAATGCGVRCESPGEIEAQRVAKRFGFSACRL